MPLSRINDELLKQFDLSSCVAESALNACFPFAAHSSRAMVALELVSHPEQRAKNGGAIIAGQIHDTSLDDEASEFNEMPRALAALDLTGAHIMPRPCCLLTVARRPVAPERHQGCAQLPVQFAAPVLERTRLHAWPMPPSSQCPSSRPA